MEYGYGVRIEDGEKPAGRSNLIQDSALSVYNKNPKQGTFVQPVDGRLVKVPRVGTERTPPAAVCHRRLVRSRDSFGQNLFGCRFDDVVRNCPKATNPGDNVDSPPPNARGTVVPVAAD